MRNAWLKLGASLGAVGALLLAVPGFAQTQTPPPSLIQSPPMAFPDLAQTQPSDQPPPGAATAPATSAEPAKPATTPEKAKTKAKAIARAKKPAKTAKAKAPSQAAPEAAAPGEAKPVAKTKHAGKLKAGMTKVAHAPRDIVQAIYEVAAGTQGDYAGPSAFDDAKIRQLYFSKGLNAAIAALQAKSGGGPILNFDPITNSEGPDVQNLDVASESEHPGRVSVAARFKSTADSSIVHYDFIKEGNAWKIDDIRGEIQGQSGQWSLREIIRNRLH
jgi:hypothetical protein